MTLRNIFINSAGRLRSGWRLVIFTVSFFLIFFLSQFLIVALVTAAFRQRGSDFLSSIWGLVLSNTLMLVSASGVGYGLGRLFEGLPFAATGWGLHRGWIRDFVVGSALGGVSLSAAALIAFAASGLRFTAGGGTATSRAETILISLFAYILFAASEEALFRGYPLQTMKRAHLAWVSIVITSLLFGSAHLGNPNVVPGFTLVNTILAGVWLAAGFLKTRSLWFPLGLHWSWNWVMGSILGLPVSGITLLTQSPLVRSVDRGPAWLTGGTYGIEGGAACTLVVILSTLAIWKMPWPKPAAEMTALMDNENTGPGGLRLPTEHVRPVAHLTEQDQP